MQREIVTMDGTEAAAFVAYNLSEVIAIYPITPSSGMGELSDAWSAQKKKNIWGDIPSVTEMQHEGGAAGAVHGALQAGALSTTFTASQGLLLMIPSMYKIAGELTPTVFHIAARSLAAQGLSIYGDHQDVMATRATGFAMMASGSVQEVMDLAAVTHASTLEARIPFLHFFDGFRTSHEVNKIERLSQEDLRALVDESFVMDHRERALNPDHPVLRGTSQNPDVYFQARETVNTYYNNTPAIVQKYMDKLAKATGRQYHLFDYYGHPEAERVIVVMGSAIETVHETVDYLMEKGDKVGVIKVRLYRPFSADHLIAAFPKSVKSVAVLDRTKEPGAQGEPLYLDVVTSMAEHMAQGKLPFAMPKMIGGRYGLSSKEFTPAMVAGIYNELSKEHPKNHFTIGIIDDVTHTSLDYDHTFSTEPDSVFRGMFYGLGADGTVSANKNSIKIIGEETDNHAQGYFFYDSKKSGSITISHIRFGKNPIRSTYLVTSSNFIACHQFQFLTQYDMLKNAAPGGIFLLNAPYEKDEVWNKLPRKVQQQMIDKKMKFYVIDAYKVAKDTGMGVRINTIMQTCFFAISGILPREEAIAKIKENIKKTYGKKGDEIVQKNFAAVDHTLAHLFEIPVSSATSTIEIPPPVSPKAPDFIRNVTSMMLSGDGDDIPVSKLPADGTYPVASAMWEKRNISLSVPVWDEDICTQCGKCVLICPHAVIRQKIYDGALVQNAPSTFKHVAAKGQDWPEGSRYSLQVSVEDCTGCELCVEICPVKNKTEVGKKAINMADVEPIKEEEMKNWDFFLSIPEMDRRKLNVGTIKGSQFLQPLFEFSGACSGCGETPYVKLVTQLFGDRALIGNATGCSSIYGGNLPTTPYTQNADGRGPAWSNSLFEDTAEFGLGFRLAIEKKEEQSRELLKSLASNVGQDLVDGILKADQSDETGIYDQRERVHILVDKLKQMGNDNAAKHLLSLTDYLVKKSVWIFGGDGWAYDIGYSGVDHVIASGKNVNILVLDTEVYSNTGGQMSKATPTGAVAKFAAGGKTIQKKDLGLQAISYGSVYVAQVAMGANETQTIKAMLEAERYDGPSVIIAYSHCIAHGYDLKFGVDQQKLAVNSAYWPLYRFNPMLALEGKNPLQLDSKDPKVALKDFLYNETRFKMLTKMDPAQADRLLKQAEREVIHHWNRFKGLAAIDYSHQDDSGSAQSANASEN